MLCRLHALRAAVPVAVVCRLHALRAAVTVAVVCRDCAPGADAAEKRVFILPRYRVPAAQTPTAEKTWMAWCS